MLRCERRSCLPVADQSQNQGRDPDPSLDQDPDPEDTSEAEQIHVLNLRCHPEEDIKEVERIQSLANVSGYLG